MAQTNEQSITGRDRNPMIKCNEACRANDVSLMELALSNASKPNSIHTVQAVAQQGLRRSARRGAIHVFNYLIDNPHHGADVAELSALDIMLNDDNIPPPQEILEILVAHGWDVNSQRHHNRTCPPLIWYVVEFPDLVRWCLDQGARVDIPDTLSEVKDGIHSWKPVTILGVAASSGTVETFELLRSKGALLDPGTLHRAVQQAMYSAPRVGDEPGAYYIDRMDMVRHLVDVVKLDVNAVQHVVGRCSTPLCIAVSRPTNQQFQELVDFLLDRGADPYLNSNAQEVIKNWTSAIACALTWRNMHLLKSLKDRQPEKQVGKQGEPGGDAD